MEWYQKKKKKKDMKPGSFLCGLEFIVVFFLFFPLCVHVCLWERERVYVRVCECLHVCVTPQSLTSSCHWGRHMMFSFCKAASSAPLSGASHLEALISYFNYFVRLKSAANRILFFFPSKVRLHLNDNNKCQSNVNACTKRGDALPSWLGFHWVLVMTYQL